MGRLEDFWTGSSGGSTGQRSRRCFRRSMARRGERQAIRLLTMVKILLLQQWHTLSDPAAKEAVRDRLSFRRFCGMPLEVETPDHASIWRFRQTIDKLGLSVALLAETNRQLDALG